MGRDQLLSEIETLQVDTLRRCDALAACDQFVASATDEAAHGFGFAFFGRMRQAAEAIPVAFEQLDPRSPVKGVDRRLQPYIRSQLFIALVAEVEVFVNQLLRAVLVAFPKKLQDRKLQLKDVLEAGGLDAVVAQAAQAEVHELFYAKPKDIRKYVERILSIPSAELDEIWPAYVEMKARRDIGLHSDWLRNPIYDQKVWEVDADIPAESFLGVGPEYFRSTLEVTRRLVSVLAAHCLRKFGPPQHKAT